jgi:hypothetical protein
LKRKYDWCSITIVVRGELVSFFVGVAVEVFGVGVTLNLLFHHFFALIDIT